MLMRPHDGGVDHGVFVVGLLGQHREDALSHAAFRPTREAGMDDAVIAESLRQVSPRNACPVTVAHRFDEQAVIPCRPAHSLLDPGANPLSAPIDRPANYNAWWLLLLRALRAPRQLLTILRRPDQASSVQLMTSPSLDRFAWIFLISLAVKFEGATQMDKSPECVH